MCGFSSLESRVHTICNRGSNKKGVLFHLLLAYTCCLLILCIVHFTPPGDPSIHPTYITTVLHPSLQCYCPKPLLFHFQTQMKEIFELHLKLNNYFSVLIVMLLIISEMLSLLFWCCSLVTLLLCSFVSLFLCLFVPLFICSFVSLFLCSL